jgi:hypothetical protein
MRDRIERVVSAIEHLVFWVNIVSQLSSLDCQILMLGVSSTEMMGLARPLQEWYHTSHCFILG